ncbi:MAG: hypothetical protein JRG92_07300 [Deltaproteobacteria bacterium]|nr:hypothetical protein [Deltaproteobacteria bacterium]MBW2383423.1 hypothetical protein [Deltaproteobacteria bacterium]
MHRSQAALSALLGALLCAAALGCHDIHLDYDLHADDIVLFDDLYSISVVDKDHAVSVGYYGSVYVTSDGGQTWSQGRTDTLKSLYNVSMADAQYGWAVGQRGLILRTEDGGNTWVRQPNNKEKEGAHLFGVAAIDASTALAIGEWGTRLRTSDGGETWVDNSFTVDQAHPMFQWLSSFEQEKIRRGETVFEDVGLNDVFCLGVPSRRCWLIGEFGYIFHSDDAGETWERSHMEGSVELDAIRLGYNEVEFDESYVPILEEFASSIVDEAHLNVAIEPVASREEIRNFGVEGDPFEFFEILEARMQEVRSVLEDTGLAYERVRLRAQPPWDYEDYLDDDPEFLKRYFDGREYAYPGVKVRVIQNPILFTVRFRDENHGLISGLGGVVLVSSDGGRNWRYSKIDQKMAVFSVGSTTARVIAVGEKGLVRVSVDDGRSWAPPSEGSFPKVFTFMRDVDFESSGEVGFIVGQAGQILKSVDAGYVWEQVLPPEPTEG